VIFICHQLGCFNFPAIWKNRSNRVLDFESTRQLPYLFDTQKKFQSVGNFRWPSFWLNYLKIKEKWGNILRLTYLHIKRTNWSHKTDRYQNSSMGDSKWRFFNWLLLSQDWSNGNGSTKQRCSYFDQQTQDYNFSSGHD
jgi:hypothetical protein